MKLRTRAIYYRSRVILWLLRRLVGKRTIVINAKFKNGTLILSQGAIVCDSSFEFDSPQPGQAAVMYPYDL